MKRKRKLLTQRVLGLGLALLSVTLAALSLAWQEDATAWFLTAPLAAWLLTTRKVVIL